eukprot:GDKH01024197.1.p1 GENE.GDKH01024197.1~~GDKH01024197.1.p1  ORF type:complete len:354 (-),score=34.70 GDKH01024197.1:80-1141(-)
MEQLASWKPALQEDECERLVENGFVVIENFFGRQPCKDFLSEIQQLDSGGQMIPNRTKFILADGTSALFEKPHVHELDMHSLPEPGLACVPLLQSLFLHEADKIVDCLMLHAPELHLRRGTAARTIKLQKNSGCGACFPMHYDNAGPPSNRKVTCLVYLNERWKAGDGGEIELTPFLRSPVKIEPLFDRAVLFLSDAILHRVCPNFAERFCFTIWLDAAPDAVNLRDHIVPHVSSEVAANAGRLAMHLHLHPAQRSLSRAVYAEEYMASLKDIRKAAALANQVAHGVPLDKVLSVSLDHLELGIDASKKFDAMEEAHMAHQLAVQQTSKLGEMVQRLRILKTERSQKSKVALA